MEKVRRRRGRRTGGVAPAAIMFSRCDMVSDYPCRRSAVPLIQRCGAEFPRVQRAAFVQSAPSRATRKLGTCANWTGGIFLK